MKTETALASDGLAEEDALRADMYAFLSALLSRPPSRDLLESTAGLTGDASAIGRAVGTLAELAAKLPEAAVRREHDALFVGLARGELLPYASYYLTGFLNEKPLAKLRSDMAVLGVARADGVPEPEDRIASLMEMMAGLIRGEFTGPVAPEAQRRFFETHVEPWAGHFFKDLEAAEASVFYAPVGTIGREFMDVERDAFRMTA